VSSTRKTGSIARLVRDRAFGFIYCQADERDYFFHQAHLENCTFPQLQEGDVVSFTIGNGRDGRTEAQEVRFDHHDAPPGQETRAQVGLPDPPKRRKVS
jgi:cold shock CspA family protein